MFIPYEFKDSESKLSTTISYEILKKIGKGTFSTVFLARDNTSQKEFAMKVHFVRADIEEKKKAIVINDS